MSLASHSWISEVWTVALILPVSSRRHAVTERVDEHDTVRVEIGGDDGDRDMVPVVPVETTSIRIRDVHGSLPLSSLPRYVSINTRDCNLHTLLLKVTGWIS